MLRGSYPSGHKLVRGPLQSSLPLVPKLNDRRPDMAPDSLSVVEWCISQPTPSAQRPATKPKSTSDDVEGARMKAINVARQKAWDEKTKRAMRGICHGC